VLEVLLILTTATVQILLWRDRKAEKHAQVGEEQVAVDAGDEQSASASSSIPKL
jgi:hypothetical protein